MAMSEWSASGFSAYPPLGHEFAERHLSLLQQLPLPLTILMLREISAYDWRFPAERRMLEDQFAWLQSLSPAELSEILRQCFFPAFRDLDGASLRWQPPLAS